MSEEEMEILKELSEQNYFGDLPFLLYADLIGKLIANYNKEKEKNKELEEEDVKIRAKFILQLDNYILKSKVEELIKELDKTDSKVSKSLFNDDCGTWTKAIQNLLKRELLEE